MRRAIVIAALVAAAACAPRDESPAPWHDEGSHRWRDLRTPSGGDAGFTAMPPSRTGVRFRDAVPDDSIFANRHMAHGSGVAIGDVNGDGMPDLFLAGMTTPGVLYLNRGGWKFEDATAASGIAVARHATGVTLADVDGDRDLDLLVASLGGPNQLWRNDGTGKFADATRESGLESRLGSTSLALADVDADGDLDLYIATYKTKSAMDIWPPQERAFDQVVRRVGNRSEVVERFREHFRVEDRPDLNAVVRTQRADPDLFYLNDGAGRFTRVPIAGSSRFLDEDGRPLATEPDFFGLAAAFHDLNGDHRPDLWVCNDFEDPDQVWINQGAGVFRLAQRLAIRATSNSCMSVAFADVDGDGHDDVFSADMLANDSRRRKTQTPTHTPLPKRAGQSDDRPQMQRNTLQLARGDGTFAQAAELAGVDASGWTWGSTFVDVDLDGRDDLLVATGHAFDVMDADTWEKIRTQFLRYDWRREMALFPRLPLSGVAFRNNGDLTFRDATAEWRYATEPAVAHAVATGDLDGDGDQDVVQTRLGAAPLLLRSDAAAPRLLVRLAGDAPNTAGVGARIRVTGGAVPAQAREVQAGGLYLASGDPAATFAAGRARAMTIDVEWPGGKRSRVAGAVPGREYEIREATAIAAPSDSSGASEAATLFADATATLSHAHAESAFDDFARQPLLDLSLGRLGPGASWYDADDDGDEDLLVPAGKGSSLALLRNDGARFGRSSLGGAAAGDLTMALALPDAGGRTMVVAGQSSHEAATPGEALAMPAVVRARGASADPVVPGDTGSTGAIAMADVDGDGDLDLFVAARAVAGVYPLAGPSRLLRNDGGRFVPDGSNAATFSGSGLVSSATFSDVDGDGDPDLVLAREWAALALYLNDRGRFTAAPASWGLAALVGRWNGIAAGDFDGDGRMDLVATSWGRNTRWRASAERPLYLYFGHFDDNGTLDLLPAQQDERLGAIAPLTGLGRLTVAVPSLRARVPTYAAYADMTVDQLLGDRGEKVKRVGATTLDHVLLLNRGGRFEATPLPLQAQLAPSFGVAVADADGDGHEDVVLAQNFFPTEVESPRYDAGRGLLLRGDGKGGLVAVPGQRSGIRAYGDGRGVALADYDRDGRVDVAMTQNGGPTQLFRNTGAKPGLRVRLTGPAANPRAYGSTMRVVHADGTRGPSRELHAGGGYWSLDGAAAVLGLREAPSAVWVRWPGGAETTTPVPPGAREITIPAPGAAARPVIAER